MASSSTNLQDYIQREGRLSSKATNLHNLPANQSTVLKVLSKPNEMPYKQLCQMVEALPDNRQLTQSQLDGTLYELVRMGYLTSFTENGDVIYMLQVELGKIPPPQRHEQRLMRKLDLRDLKFDDLHRSQDDTNP